MDKFDGEAIFLHAISAEKNDFLSDVLKRYADIMVRIQNGNISTNSSLRTSGERFEMESIFEAMNEAANHKSVSEKMSTRSLKDRKEYIFGMHDTYDARTQTLTHTHNGRCSC